MIKVSLPYPPSLNHIWRRGKQRTYLSPKYVAWTEEAGWMIRMQTKGVQPIVGRFKAEIKLRPPDKRRRDMDNSVKVLLDIAQKYGLVADDCYCKKLDVEEILDDTQPVGAVLTLTAMSS